MLRTTDQIRDTVRQMSALVLCSRHEHYWHTNQRKGGGRKKKESWASTDEKMDDRRRKGGKRKREQRRTAKDREWKELEFKHHMPHTSLVEWNLLWHVSVSRQPVGSEGDTESLDVSQVAAVALTELGAECENPTCVETKLLQNAQKSTYIYIYINKSKVVNTWPTWPCTSTQRSNTQEKDDENREEGS